MKGDQMSDTPRTDDHAQIAFQSGGGVRFMKGTQDEPGYIVSTDFARELERENAELRADKARLRAAIDGGNIK